MEKRQATEVKLWFLILNHMRGNTENGTCVASSYDKKKLIDWHNSQLAPAPYEKEGSPSFECHGDSHRWHKVFIEGGPLEWFNPCDNFDGPDHYGNGLKFEWGLQDMIERVVASGKVGMFIE